MPNETPIDDRLTETIRDLTRGLGFDLPGLSACLLVVALAVADTREHARRRGSAYSAGVEDAAKASAEWQPGTCPHCGCELADAFRAELEHHKAGCPNTPIGASREWAETTNLTRALEARVDHMQRQIDALAKLGDDRVERTAARNPDLVEAQPGRKRPLAPEAEDIQAAYARLRARVDADRNQPGVEAIIDDLTGRKRSPDPTTAAIQEANHDHEVLRATLRRCGWPSTSRSTVVNACNAISSLHEQSKTDRALLARSVVETKALLEANAGYREALDGSRAKYTQAQERIAALEARQQELLQTIARVSQATPFPDEVAGWEGQRAAMIAEVGTLRSRERNLYASLVSALGHDPVPDKPVNDDAWSAAFRGVIGLRTALAERREDVARSTGCVSDMELSFAIERAGYTAEIANLRADVARIGAAHQAGIDRWSSSAPDRAMADLPPAADLVVWLLEQLSDADAQIANLRDERNNECEEAAAQRAKLERLEPVIKALHGWAGVTIYTPAEKFEAKDIALMDAFDAWLKVETAAINAEADVPSQPDEPPDAIGPEIVDPETCLDCGGPLVPCDCREGCPGGRCADPKCTTRGGSTAHGSVDPIVAVE